MTTELGHFDFAVIGAGIAGSSIAAELSGHGSTVVLEMEDQPGYHTTGRSAAVFTLAYGPPIIRALTRAAHPFFRGETGDGPDGLLRPRPVVFLAREDQLSALSGLRADLGSAVDEIGVADVAAMIPPLRPGYAAGALIDPQAADLDVNALHQHYLRRGRSQGVRIETRAGVERMARGADGWILDTRAGRVSASVVVNAAGAWADEVGRMAGLQPLGLRPLRRTALLVHAPAGPAPDDWPMVVDAQERFYMRPDAGRLLLSPADETPSQPCDAQPEEIDVAICIDRIQAAFDLDIRRIEHKWAGLRSFLPDGDPVAGYAPGAPGFFWLAGQGGYGMQTAPALARAAAALVLGRALPDDLVAQGVSADGLSPARFAVDA